MMINILFCKLDRQSAASLLADGAGGRSGELVDGECIEREVAALASRRGEDEAFAQRGVGHQHGGAEAHLLVGLKDELQLGGRSCDLPAEAHHKAVPEVEGRQSPR